MVSKLLGTSAYRAAAVRDACYTGKDLRVEATRERLLLGASRGGCVPHAHILPRGSKLDVASLDRSTFEFIVGAWLHHLVLGLWQPSEPDEKRAFVDSGLLELVENGRFASNIAA